MEIVNAVLADGDADGTAERFLHNLIAWYNLHPDLCQRLYGYLRQFRTTHLDPSIRVSWIASLRILEYSIVKVLKPSQDPLHIATFQSYQRCVKQYSKDLFDIYCRVHHVTLFLQDGKKRRRLETSIAQMNMMRWLLTKGRSCVSIAHARARHLGRYRRFQ